MVRMAARAISMPAGGPSMRIVREGGLVPGSDSCGTWMRVPLRDCRSRMVAPPRPIIWPHRSFGTCTVAIVLPLGMPGGARPPPPGPGGIESPATAAITSAIAASTTACDAPVTVTGRTPRPSGSGSRGSCMCEVNVGERVQMAHTGASACNCDAQVATVPEYGRQTCVATPGWWTPRGQSAAPHDPQGWSR